MGKDHAIALLEGPETKPPRDDFAPPGRRARQNRNDLQGKVYPVGPGTTQQEPAPGPVQPAQHDGVARKYTLTFQPTAMPTPGTRTGNTTPLLYALITYWQGDISYTFLYGFTASNLNVRRFFTCSANRIEVFFFANPLIQPSGQSYVRASIAQGEVRSTDFYTWQSSTEVANTGDNGQLVALNVGGVLGNLGPGVIGQYHVILTTAANPGTPLYVLFFDSPTAPTAGQEAIAGGTSDALFQAGDSRSYDDEWSPGWQCFSTGLWVALSTTPQVYTAPAAGNILYAVAKIGQ